MTKTIDYYMNLPYTRELIPELEGGWFVRIKELPNCMSQGDTPEEALRMIEDAMRGWLAVELEDGEPIPEPREEEEYSGKFNTRVPKSLHRKLVEAADREGVSLNQWINTALAEAVGGVAARLALQVYKTEETSTQTQWPGLSQAMRQILQNVGKGYEAGVIDERLFAGWLDQNLSEIQMDCEKRSFDQALEKARALSALLEEQKQHSPIVHSFSLFARLISQLIELNLDMNQEVARAEMIRAQISTIVSNVNLPIQSRAQVLEKNRFATTTVERESVSLEISKSASGW